jgi:hypothetical protein
MATTKKTPRKKTLKNKGVKINRTGRHSFANTALAKELKKHNQYMPHGYEIGIHVKRDNRK